MEGLEPVTADLLDTESVEQALKDISPTQVFFTAWMRKETEEENIRTNGTMVKTFSTPCLSKIGAPRGIGYRAETLSGTF
uniref:Uncharacterized protein n=1 Tax=Chryseobacterium endophyticum TaxID=1854762 RepID=A0AAU6WJ47_9FLAO